MHFIDSHTHIYLPEFDMDRQQMLERAAQQQVFQMLMPAVDSSTHVHMHAVAEQWPQCLPMMGLHPCSVKADVDDELATVQKNLAAQHYVAIGEIGLDFYWDTTFRNEQYRAFETQIQWALQFNLPIVIHSREAIDACIDVVANYPALRGVFHCFSGSVAQAERILNQHFFLGIGGVVTYKKAGLDAVVQAVGLDGLLLETDAPYLAPVPYRGKRNESSYLPIVAQKIADATGRSVEEVASITTQNAKRLFGLG